MLCHLVFFDERTSFSIHALAAQHLPVALNVFMAIEGQGNTVVFVFSFFFPWKCADILEGEKWSAGLVLPVASNVTSGVILVIVNHGARPVCCVLFVFFLWRVLKASLTGLLQHVLTPKSSSAAAWSVALHFKLGSSLHGRKGRAQASGKAGGAAAARGARRWRLT